MKIKTIVRALPVDFDEQVNEMLKEGYILEHRGILQGMNGETFHYGQLVQHDRKAEPDPVEIDGIQALHIVKAACLAHKGPCNDCPMTDWCAQLQHGGDPTDWVLPAQEV